MTLSLAKVPFGLLSPVEQQATILRILKMLEPVSALKFDKIRVGSQYDGGYVQLNDFSGVSHAFSLGISDNDSWDLDVAMRGIPVEQVDYSVEATPSNHPNLRFHKKMASADNGDGKVTLREFVG